jgi:Cupin domain
MPEGITAPLLAQNILGSTKDSFVIAEWRDAGGPPGPPRYIAPLHLHHHDDEAWYVLEGVLRVKSGDNEIEAHPGAAVLVRRGTAHTFWNAGPGLLRYLLIMPPNIYGLIQDIHATSDRSAAAMQAIFRKHGSELLG